MTPETFNAWLAAMKAAGRADTDADCAVALDVSRNTIVTLKRNGADRRTALACAALLAGLEAYHEVPPRMDQGTHARKHE